MIEITLSSGEQIALKHARVRKLKGTRLPGCELYRGDRKGLYSVIFQEFDDPYFNISFCAIYMESLLKFTINEKKKGLRLVVLLTGEMEVKFGSTTPSKILAGQYFIAESFQMHGRFRAPEGCTFFTAYFTTSFLQSLGVKERIQREEPLFLPGSMRDTVDEILTNPYDQKLRSFYYDIAISRLLLDHLAIPAMVPKGDLSDSEVAAVYTADRIIAENLEDHITINALAKKAGTNAYVLKKGFHEKLGVSVFQRLVQRRMEKAKDLLEVTNKPIKEICELAGYQTLGGFITAFKKRFGLTPKDWRKHQRHG